MENKKVFILTPNDICAIPTLIAYRQALQVAGGEGPEVKNLTDEVENLINLFRNEQGMNPPAVPAALAVVENGNVSALVNEICDLKNELTELYEIRAMLQNQAAKDAARIASFGKSMDAMNEALSTCHKTKASAEQENEIVSKERDEMKRELEVRTATITALNKEVEDLRAEMKSAKSEYRDMSDRQM